MCIQPRNRIVWILERIFEEVGDFHIFKYLNVFKFNIKIKRTVSVISSDPSCTDGNARFTTVPFKALSDQVWIRYQCLQFRKLIILNCGFFYKLLQLIYNSTGCPKKTGISVFKKVLKHKVFNFSRGRLGKIL